MSSLKAPDRRCMGKSATRSALIIIDLTHLISFELRRVIDENACKELLNLIDLPAKKIAQRAQRESNTDFKVKVCVFLSHHQYICAY